MDIGTRVKKLRKSKGWTQEKLSELTKLSRGRIAQLETDPTAEVRNDSFISLARAFGLSCEQLIAPDLFTSSLLTELEFQPKANKVPMISWESLPIFVEGTLIIDGSEWIGCPYDLSEKSCVLEVQDELMTAIHGRSYPKGALIFVDAEREPQAGDRVIAIDTVTLLAVFREYITSGSAQFLKPLNERYPIRPLQKSTSIIGVVAGSYMPG